MDGGRLNRDVSGKSPRPIPLVVNEGSRPGLFLRGGSLINSVGHVNRVDPDTGAIIWDLGVSGPGLLWNCGFWALLRRGPLSIRPVAPFRHQTPVTHTPLFPLEKLRLISRIFF